MLLPPVEPSGNGGSFFMPIERSGRDAGASDKEQEKGDESGQDDWKWKADACAKALPALCISG